MISSILYGLATIVAFLLDLLMMVIFASALISWVDANPYNRFVMIIRQLTEPLYRPFRKLTRNIALPIDLSPMIVIIIVMFLKSALPHYLYYLARTME